MRIIKIYITVGAEFSPDGNIKPTYLIWQDGRKFEIDKVGEVRYASARVGAELPIRFTCEICGAVKYLYYEETLRKWFVERELS